MCWRWKISIRRGFAQWYDIGLFQDFRRRHLELQMTRASRAVASPRVVCIEDFRPIARQRVPKSVFDYLDGGAEGEVTLRENCRVFNDLFFGRGMRSRSAAAIRGRARGLRPALPLLRRRWRTAVTHREAKWRQREPTQGWHWQHPPTIRRPRGDVRWVPTGRSHQLINGGRGAAQAAIERGASREFRRWWRRLRLRCSGSASVIIATA